MIDTDELVKRLHNEYCGCLDQPDTCDHGAGKALIAAASEFRAALRQERAETTALISEVADRLWQKGKPLPPTNPMREWYMGGCEALHSLRHELGSTSIASRSPRTESSSSKSK